MDPYLRPAKAVAAIISTRSANPMPAASAAIGIRELSVIPGMVLISSTHGVPESSKMISTRP